MSLARSYRTLRELKPRQALAQLAHALRPEVRPVHLGTAPPVWSAPAVGAHFCEAPEHARWDGAGRVELVGETVDFGALDAIDWLHAGAGALWAYQLHFFEWARDASVPAAARAQAVAHWLECCSSGAAPLAPAWDPHPLSLRTLSWLKLCLEPGALARDEALDARIRASLADQIETLSRNLEVRLQANHLLDNLIAVVAGGLALDGPASAGWLARRSALEREIADQIDEDGVHCERSPMYHAILLEHLLDLLNVARSVGARAPGSLCELLVETCGRMLGAQRVWTHPDGRIALFGDSVFGLAASPARLETYAASLGVQVREPRERGLLRAAGFARLESRDLTLIATIAAPSPAHQPGHSHCDALSFELSAGSDRIVADTGVYEYAPGTRRDRSRSTRAHATAVIESEEQAELWAAHRVGGRPQVKVTSAEEERWIEGTVRGWNTPETTHRRQFLVVPSGLEIADRIERRKRPVRLALPLAPGIGAAPEDLASHQLSVPLGDGRTLEWSLPSELRWRIETGPYYPRFGTEQERTILVGEAARLDTARMQLKIRR